MRRKPRRLRCFSQWGSLEREKKEKEGRGYRWRRWEETPRNAEEGGEEGRKLVVVVVVICGILDRRIDGVGQEIRCGGFFRFGTSSVQQWERRTSGQPPSRGGVLQRRNQGVKVKAGRKKVGVDLGGSKRLSARLDFTWRSRDSISKFKIC